jgi:nitrite reductase/ring-hydroxylating ferredoxin subunit
MEKQPGRSTPLKAAQVAPRGKSTEGEAPWIKAAPVGKLAARGRCVAKLGRKQIALFERDGAVLACNNRCPHEGYPLVEGTLDDSCVLTCNWHNWKFDLASGKNLMGFDELPTYETRIADGHVWVRLTEEPAELRQATALRRLRAAFDDHDYERLARELARFEAAGGDPVGAVADAIRWSHDRFEFGMTHAYAAAADWLALHDSHPRDREIRMLCLVEAIGHMAWDALRQPQFPYAKRRRPYDPDRLTAAIESEDEAAAIGMVRGALAAGLGFADLEGPLARAALAHYADFGHSAIYIVKAGALIRRLGPAVTEPVLLALVRQMVFAFREDQIPEFRGYAERRRRYPATQANGRGTPDSAALATLSINRSMDWVVEAASHHSPEALHKALLLANGRNLLGYDTRFQERSDNAVSTNVGWLDFSHGLTFGNAVRTLAGRHPELWPDGLLQMACFNGRNSPFVDHNADRRAWFPKDVAGFWAVAEAKLFDHGLRDYIFSAHLVKTAVAVRAETGQGVPGDDVLLAALNRLLSSSIKQKHVRRTVHQALDFVAKEG